MWSRTSVLVLTALACLLCGCATDWRQRASDSAQAGGFAPFRADTPDFVIAGWLRPGQGDTLLVYIEGDGHAWTSRWRPSSDPTPHDPVGLELALADPGPGPVLYLGRPCQYVTGQDRRGCSVEVWTGARFSEAVVRSLDSAIADAAARLGARSVALHGYSGGGALAALLAQRRADAIFLGTVAGLLDTDLWTGIHGDTPLRGSLNPVNGAAGLCRLPQAHVVGGRDSVVPRAVFDSWSSRCVGFPPPAIMLPQSAHSGPWIGPWPAVLKNHRPSRLPTTCAP